MAHKKKKNLFRMEKKKKILIFIKVDNIIEKKIKKKIIRKN